MARSAMGGGSWVEPLRKLVDERRVFGGCADGLKGHIQQDAGHLTGGRGEPLCRERSGERFERLPVLIADGDFDALVRSLDTRW